MQLLCPWPWGHSRARLLAAMPPSSGVRAAVGDGVDTTGCRRIIYLPTKDQRFAVLIAVLSGCENLALHWVRLKQMQSNRWKPGLAVDVSGAVLRRWQDSFAADETFLNCLVDTGAPLRAQVHLYLAESVAADRVRELSGVGMLVPSRFVVALYCRLLQALPQVPAVVDQTRRLHEKPSYTKKWMKRWRLTWGVAWSATPVPHGIGTQHQERRAGVFFRWMLFELAAASASDVIVVNMDETMLSAVKERKKGNTDARMGHGSAFSGFARRPASMPRTSLIASVCSSVDVQKVLPQIRVVRGEVGKTPSRAVLAAYADAGAPQIAQHGGNGWCTTVLLMWWLRCMMTALRKVKPAASVILVMDACPSHTSDAFLAACSRARVRLVIVPAKMTWCLQPLDTHVFSTLKQRIREREFEDQVQQGGAPLSHLQRVRAHGAAVDDVLVKKDWSGVMMRACMARDVAGLRASVQPLVAEQDFTPRLPCIAEFQDILSVVDSRAAKIHSFFHAARTPAAHAAAACPDRGGPTSAGASGAVPAPTTVARHMLPITLRAAARLPGAPASTAPAANVWLPTWAIRKPITRSASRLALAAAEPGTTSTELPAPKRAKRA